MNVEVLEFLGVSDVGPVDRKFVIIYGRGGVEKIGKV